MDVVFLPESLESIQAQRKADRFPVTLLPLKYDNQRMLVATRPDGYDTGTFVWSRMVRREIPLTPYLVDDPTAIVTLMISLTAQSIARAATASTLYVAYGPVHSADATMQRVAVGFAFQSPAGLLMNTTEDTSAISPAEQGRYALQTLEALVAIDPAELATTPSRVRVFVVVDDLQIEVPTLRLNYDTQVEMLADLQAILVHDLQAALERARRPRPATGSISAKTMDQMIRDGFTITE